MKELFKYEGDDQSVRDGVDLANDLYEELLAQLEDANVPILSGYRGKYNKDFTSYNLALLIEQNIHQLQMNVKTYYQKSRAIGYFTASRPGDINLNTYHFPRDIQSISATLWHELMHLLNTLVEVDLGHGHGWRRNRYRRWKEECAPYLVDSLVEVMAAARLGFNLPARTDNTDYVSVPWWKRVMFFWRY